MVVQASAAVAVETPHCSKVLRNALLVLQEHCFPEGVDAAFVLVEVVRQELDVVAKGVLLGKRTKTVVQLFCGL